MTDRELEILLQDLESDRVERKASASDPDRIRETICAFANDLADHRKPGVLFIGVHDDGSVANFSITDELLLKLADMRSDGNMLPIPTMCVQKRTLSGGEVAVIVVEPCDAPPMRFRGRVWVRVGPRRAIASAEEERRLAEKRRSGDLPFDIRPVRSAKIEDLDQDLFKNKYLPAAVDPEVLAENRRSYEQQLSSLRFAALAPEIHPTPLGLLVIGKDPRRFLPCDYIQFLRIDGTGLTDPILDQKEIAGPIPDLLRILDDVFYAHIHIRTDITTSAVEIRRPDYPRSALQQLARNAVMHRSYDGTHAPVRITWYKDRIEIHNPGGPYGQVTRRNFGQPGMTDYRNPHLAEAMKTLGYVQRFGVGIALARTELANNGNPPPEFIVDDASVLAVIRKQAF